jgi:F0F1-type ATP synthase epsilon subunit
MDQNLFHLKIVAKDGILFEGQIKSLTSYNDKGRFDILGLHANFISIIYKSIVIVDAKGDKKEMTIQKALLKNKSDNLEIYLGIDNISA